MRQKLIALGSVYHRRRVTIAMVTFMLRRDPAPGEEVRVTERQSRWSDDRKTPW